MSSHGFQNWNDKFTRHPIGFFLKAGYFYLDNYQILTKNNTPKNMQIYSGVCAPVKTILLAKTRYVIVGELINYLNSKAIPHVPIPIPPEMRGAIIVACELLFTFANFSNTLKFCDEEPKLKRAVDLHENLVALRGILREIGEFFDPVTGRIIPITYDNLFDD